MGALSHIRVLDLSRVLAGPWCTQMLADLGADVIKIERPGVGDDTRQWGPPFIPAAGSTGLGESTYFLGANRGKRSVTINLAERKGQALAREMAALSDVVVENFKVGALARYGLDYLSLKALNPRLVYCSITGFGQNGPYADRAGYDFMIQGMGGLMSITGEAEGTEGAGPQKVGVAMADIVTGLYCASAIQAALIHRDRSGEGQYIDMALLDCQVAVLANQAMMYLAAGEVPNRMGNAHPNIVPYQVFATRDAHLILAVGNDGQFKRLCDLLGRPELAEDERFATNRARVAHRSEIINILAKIIRQKSTDEWVPLIESQGIPCGRINRIDQALDEAQVKHRNMRTQVVHQGLGEIDILASPIRMSETPTRVDRAPPMLGEHTEEVLEELLEYSAGDISALRRSGII
ncbi:MAG: CaiB/BaiF CoA transferase family protein [Arenicellales bacterium]|jgi:crotonobetainyl-CoA:carnitine CoA-transferase CaiB-like acyl-CoA transferase|nr:CoA transferase [Gammaproteobacteria bacterium]NDA13867.1 CoA transferase [Gammaproteobacteria bacterium]NDG43845.1 CoA transferase [Gammaproteobacteria bacterium]